MKKNDEIQMDAVRLSIDVAQRSWNEIKAEIQRLGMYDSEKLSIKKEKLKNILEEIRRNLEVFLFSCNDSIFRRITVNHLERILDISEGLRKTYMFPGYVESYYIADTIELAKR